MDKVVKACIDVFHLDDKVRIIDLGCGVGKPNWHFITYNADVSIGIDCVSQRIGYAFKSSSEILHECRSIDNLAYDKINIGFKCVDITDVSSLAYFDLIYMSDCGFTPDLLKHIAKLTLSGGRCRYLVSYHNNRTLQHYGFQVKLVHKITKLSLFGSKSSRTAYFYMIGAPYHLVNDHPIIDDNLCDVVSLAKRTYSSKLHKYQELTSKYFDLKM